MDYLSQISKYQSSQYRWLSIICWYAVVYFSFGSFWEVEFIKANRIRADDGTALQSSAKEIEKPRSNLWTRKKGSDWPRMMGPNGDGKSDEKGLLTDWSDGKLKVKWQAETGTGYGNCTVAEGRCFQMDRYGDKERLICRQAETGETLWSWECPVEYRDMFGYNNGTRSSPVVDEGLVFVLGVAGTLAAMDIETGKEIWRRATSTEYSVIPNFFGVGTTPCVFEDLLLVMIGGNPTNVKSEALGKASKKPSSGSAVVAFDKRTGREVYRMGNYQASYSAPVLATIDGTVWCAVLVREGLLVFDPRDGSHEAFFPWRASIKESVNAAWPVVFENQIFISETYEKGSALLRFDGKKLEPIWTDRMARNRTSWRAHWATPILVDGHLFGCSGRNEPDSDFRSVRWSDGEINWLQRNHTRTTLLLVDHHLVVIGEHGLLQLIAMDTSNYRVITDLDLGDATGGKGVDGSERAYLESPVWAPPTLAHGLLYLRGRDRIVCLDLIPE